MPSGQRVYLGNLPDDAREKDVEKFFRGYGRMREISLKNGYGFVEFEDYRDADDAVHDKDGKDFLGGRVRVELARERRGGDRRSPRRDSRFGSRDGRRGNPPGRKTNYRLIVENLSSKTSWQDLKDYFRCAGEITYTNAHKPRQGEGVVEFGDRRGMEYALDKLDDTDLDGRRIRLVEEGKGRGRSRSPSRSRSPRSRSPRSRSRSRSNSRNGDDTKEASRSRSPSRSRSRSGSRDQGE